MKRLGILFLLIAIPLIGQAQINEQFVVQSGHSSSRSKKVLDKKRGLLITYGDDKTLKFWDDKSGLLLKTHEFDGFMGEMELDEEKGVTYILTNNTIYVFSNETYSEIRRYELGRIYAMDFVKSKNYRGLSFFAQDEKGQQNLYALDATTGNIIYGNIAPFPGKGEIMDFSFNNTGTFFIVYTNFLEYYVYSFMDKNYTEFDGACLGIFDDGDVINAQYDGSTGMAAFSRRGLHNNKVRWQYNFPLKGIAGTPYPHVSDVVLDVDRNSMWIVVGKATPVELNLKNGEVLRKLPDAMADRAISPFGDIMYANRDDDAPIYKYRIGDTIPLTQYGHQLIDQKQIAVYRGKDEVEFLFSSGYGKNTSSLYASPETTKLTEYPTNYRNDYSDGKFVVDPSSNKVYAITNTSDPIKVFERGKPDSFKDLINNFKEVRCFDYSPSTQQLALLWNGAVRVINTEEKKEVFSSMISGDATWDDHGLSISPQKNMLAYVTNEVVGDSLIALSDRLHYFDFMNREELWEKQGRYYSLFHLNNGKQLLAANGTEKRVEILDAATGEMVRSFPTDFGANIPEGELSPNQEYIMFSGYNFGAHIYHVPSGKLINSFDKYNIALAKAVFVTNDIFAISTSGVVKLYSIHNIEEKARIYFFRDGSWLVHTPEGLFDGPQAAWEKVAFVKDKEVIPFESVFEQFYTPRLLYQILSETGFKSNASIANLQVPPTVELFFTEGTRNLIVEEDEETARIETESPTGTLTLNGDGKGGTLSELRLYHNGKRITNATRNLVVEDEKASTDNTLKIAVELLEGVNDFTAIAVNGQGTESRPSKLTIVYKPKDEPLVKPQGIQAYLLVVGINEYQNPKYNLNYAVADAGGFQEQIQNGLSGITTKVHPYFLSNHDATRDKILEKIVEIADLANPQDIFIFYYAGHGVMSQGASSEFYLVPTDVTQLYGKDGSLEQKGISASELKRFAAGIPAQKQLYILDACQSAGALNAMVSRGAAEEKAIAQLARSTGTHWLTASGSTQFATEFDELGHGVFTYALLEALSGKADSGDHRVTVNELKAYIESRVPDISEKYKGSPQYPSSFGFGQDFPVSITEE